MLPKPVHGVAFALAVLSTLLAAPSLTTAATDEAAALKRDLETQRTSIEASRKALNADCASVPSSDQAKMADCRQRHDDVAQRMAQYREGLARLKALRTGAPTCAELGAKLTRMENGARHAADDIAKNDVMLRQTEEDRRGAVGEGLRTAGEVAGSAAADALHDRLTAFLQTEKNLQVMKKGLDELEKTASLRERARKLSPSQLEAARQWVERGDKAAADVADLASMTYDAMHAKGGKATPDAGLMARLGHAISRFNETFMEDAGGWEFAGEHLAEYGGGPGGKLAFQTAVVGIKLSAAAGGFAISQREMNELRRSQEVMNAELAKLQQNIHDLRDAMAGRKCPQR
ncbi:MAG: hypothetical protein P4L39_01080 [Humidesulfovibrio sp.]|nr:hypothetical protein [Humidesulfovibrio sp.]